MLYFKDPICTKDAFHVQGPGLWGDVAVHSI